MDRPLAKKLADWASNHAPAPGDDQLARAALVDTVCVALAARRHPVAEMASRLGMPGQWSAMAHALDYDDLHLPSTAHISAICVPAALACAGGGRAYLAGAGVMARVGTLLGWRHYQAGWHTTATAGVFGAAVAGATARGLTAEQTAAAIALSVSAASGVQRAFGSDAKPLQVGMATAAGLQAAELAAAGAQPDLDALDAWLPLVQASCRSVPDGEESIPGGLAVKIFPCCYALQRPIFAVREIARHQRLNPEDIVRIEITAPESTVKPLIHDRPANGAQGKFSLEYGIAAAVLDGFPGQWSFGDEAVRRPAAQQLRSRVRFRGTGTGKGLLDGRCEIAVHLRDGEVLTAEVDLPEGAPGRPPALEILTAKAASCLDGLEESIDDIDWESSASLLSAYAPSVTPARVGD